MRKIGEVNNHPADKCSKHLRDDIPGNLAPGKRANHCEPNGDGGINVRAADSTNDGDANEYRESPASGYHNPAGALAFALVEEHVGDHAVAKDD